MGCGSSKVASDDVNTLVHERTDDVEKTSIIVRAEDSLEASTNPNPDSHEVEETLPGATILDKKPLPPIKSIYKNHEGRPTTSRVMRSPRKLPKLEGRPATTMPFDEIVLNKSKTITEEVQEFDLENSGASTLIGEIKSAQKYIAEDDEEALAQNEQNENKLESPLLEVEVEIENQNLDVEGDDNDDVVSPAISRGASAKSQRSQNVGTEELEEAEEGEPEAAEQETGEPEVLVDEAEEAPEPEAEPVEPEAETVEAESDAPEAEVEAVEPEAEPVEPEAEPTEPEVEPVEPEAEPAEPEAEPAEPEGDAVDPEAEPVEPEAETVETEAGAAEAGAAEAEVEAAEPEAEPVEPEVDAADPEAEAAEPEVDAEPIETNVEAVDAEPVEAEPEVDQEPESELTEVEPTEPEAEPTEPEAEPAELVAETIDQEAEPEVDTAEADAAEPEAEAAEPEAEAAEPEAEAAEPEEKDAPDADSVNSRGGDVEDEVEDERPLTGKRRTVRIAEGHELMGGGENGVDESDDDAAEVPENVHSLHEELKLVGKSPFDLSDHEGSGYDEDDEDIDVPITNLATTRSSSSITVG